MLPAKNLKFLNLSNINTMSPANLAAIITAYHTSSGKTLLDYSTALKAKDEGLCLIYPSAEKNTDGDSWYLVAEGAANFIFPLPESDEDLYINEFGRTTFYEMDITRTGVAVERLTSLGKEGVRLVAPECVSPTYFSFYSLGYYCVGFIVEKKHLQSTRRSRRTY